MIYGITLIILSILAVPSLLLSKKPNAAELLGKIEPYQGWIGLLFFFWGLWNIINAILGIGLLSQAPIWWATWLAGSVLQTLLGFLLGYSTMTSLIFSKNADAEAKAQEAHTKLAPLQGKIGLFGICLGIWMIVAHILFA